MLEQDLQNNFIISNEIERIKILFEKNNYTDEQKKWFIEAKIISAKNNNDDELLKIYNKLLGELNN